jgi:hypothetical protein
MSSGSHITGADLPSKPSNRVFREGINQMASFKVYRSGVDQFFWDVTLGHLPTLQ